MSWCIVTLILCDTSCQNYTSIVSSNCARCLYVFLFLFLVLCMHSSSSSRGAKPTSKHEIQVRIRLPFVDIPSCFMFVHVYSCLLFLICLDFLSC